MRMMSEPADPPFSLSEMVHEKNQPIIFMVSHLRHGPNRLQPGFVKLCCPYPEMHCICIGKFTYIGKVKNSVVHNTPILLQQKMKQNRVETEERDYG